FSCSINSISSPSSTTTTTSNRILKTSKSIRRNDFY
ncbi:unnamed protein product, partial [Rotaria sordida]